MLDMSVKHALHLDCLRAWRAFVVKAIDPWNLWAPYYFPVDMI
jgi:hypothetical protein